MIISRANFFVVAANAICLTVSDRHPRKIHSGKRLEVRLSLSVALSTIRVTVRFGWMGLSPLFSLLLNDNLEYPPAEKSLYIYKHPCLLGDSNPGPTTQQSASLTTIPNGLQKTF
ncbi:hypothetical protein TNCV_4103691 [Trichonephila clavipes]|nr:hypothetical protein TNCV_4103691 [Trichonephila clavipes]